MSDEPKGDGAPGPTGPAESRAESAAPKAAAPAPAAAKPAPKPDAAAAAAEGVTRRGFFSWAAVAWVGFTVAIGGCLTTMGRFHFPNRLVQPPPPFTAGTPPQ